MGLKHIVKDRYGKHEFESVKEASEYLNERTRMEKPGYRANIYVEG